MTLTDIANLALSDIGQTEINSIDEASKVAKMVKRRIYATIDDVQALRDWACLTRDVALSKREEETPAGECVFNAPNGLLRVADSNADARLWRRSGSHFIAPQTTLTLRCVIAEYNPSKWDAFLRRAIVASLRAAITMPITQNADLAAQTRAMAEKEIREMALEDARQTCQRRMSTRTTWLDD